MYLSRIHYMWGFVFLDTFEPKSHIQVSAPSENPLPCYCLSLSISLLAIVYPCMLCSNDTKLTLTWPIFLVLNRQRGCTCAWSTYRSSSFLPYLCDFRPWAPVSWIAQQALLPSEPSHQPGVSASVPQILIFQLSLIPFFLLPLLLLCLVCHIFSFHLILNRNKYQTSS